MTVEKVVTEVVETTVEKVVTATPEPVQKVITFAWTQEPDTLNPYYTSALQLLGVGVRR